MKWSHTTEYSLILVIYCVILSCHLEVLLSFERRRKKERCSDPFNEISIRPCLLNDSFLERFDELSICNAAYIHGWVFVCN